MKASAIVLALAMSAGPAFAQHEHSGGQPGAERLGTVHFETSCAAAVRTDFDRAVALLHSFEFNQAIAGFNAVLAKDGNCAVAYWGIALSYWGNPFGAGRSPANLKRGLEAVQKGRTTGSPTPRERGYIEAAGALFERHDALPQRERVLAYERAMRTVRQENPQDMEASIFYALALNQTALPTDKSYEVQTKAGSILEPLFAQHPEHPGLAHYIIHAYDHPPLAGKALKAARRYATIAPSAPHALHMPSHTFTRIGYWRDSVETNRASEQAALRAGVIGEALHAMDYQAYAHLQMAQDGAARTVRDRVPALIAGFDANVIGGAAPPMAAYYAATAVPARYALERGAWAEAAQLAVPQQGMPSTVAIAHFARAIGAARSGRPADGKADVEQLALLRDKLTGVQDAYWAEQVDIQRRVALAWIAYAEGRKDEAIAALRAAAAAEDATDKAAVTPGPIAPARELLADMLLEAGRAGEALEAYEATIKKEPNRFRGTYGAARAAEAAGDRVKAAQYYKQLLEIARDADAERPELKRARDFLARGRVSEA